ncbi:MAG: EamA family transporter [Pseudomonas marincola]
MSNKPQTVDFLALLALSLMWSSSFLFIKFAVETIPPLSVAAGRLLIGALILYIFMKIKGIDLPRDGRSWLFFVGIGLIGNVIPFSLISWAELTVDSSIASILIGSLPLFSFVLGHFVTSDEKLTPDRTLGVIVGFTGIIILIGPDAILSMGDSVLGQFAIILGGAGYVVASFMARSMPKMEPRARAAGVLITASLISVPIALVVEQPWTIDPTAISLGALVVLGVFPTAIATLLLFFVIMRVGATFVALNNYLNPALGVIWGYVFVNEIPSVQTYSGLILILAGMVFTQLKLSKHFISKKKTNTST